MEASTQLNDVSKISTSIGIGGNHGEEGLGIFYHDKVSPDADPVVHMLSVSKAEKRLKKLERDYQHTYENYIETRSNRFRFYINAKHSSYRSGQAGNSIIYYKKLREQLQNNLDKMRKAEETKRGIEWPDYCKQVSMLHSCKSLAQEKRILQQIEERPSHMENSDLGQETIHHTKINWEFKYSQSRIPKSSNSKAVHDLLRRFKDTEKMREKAIIANGENVNNNPTSQDSLKTSIEMEIKLLTKVIKKLGKEIRGRETRIWTDNSHEEKMRHLEKKCEWICGKWDEEKKYLVELKKNT
ncbi:PREDICTED: uncharacterized protein LOC104791723 [Camelina sativa]|uniref:Uncharacterized protein LOC104791723 n=1 Tax=Camelina sativa TaxID=90675 RepID=A0ABM0ZHY5_CAMSA|nr:PREDICTED: uncharacterized protein LOC104791723 [Camelina sativa]